MHMVVTDWVRTGDVMMPRNINEGLCADFANVVHELFTDSEIIGVYDIDNLDGHTGPYSESFANAVQNDLIGHTALKYLGMFYDAEAINGVSRFEDLPICSATLFLST